MDFDVVHASGAGRLSALTGLVAAWGEIMVVRGTVYKLADCEVLAIRGGLGAAAVSFRDAPVAELVALNATPPGAGAGSALLAAAIELCRPRCHTLRTVTTNDNLVALRFYQRRGFVLSVLRPGAVDEARRLKPAIPQTGADGIPIRDEIELILPLSNG